jgi:hypothetical protein
MITEEEIGQGIVEDRERDSWEENALPIEGDNEAGIETIVTGEMIPVIGFEDATRILLTLIHEVDLMMAAAETPLEE